MAQETAQLLLRPIHPLKLSISLNLSVFYQEVLNDKNRAITIAKAAFDDAVQMLDRLDEKNYKECTTLLQVLRDNLYLWKSDPDNQQK